MPDTLLPALWLRRSRRSPPCDCPWQTPERRRWDSCMGNWSASSRACYPAWCSSARHTRRRDGAPCSTSPTYPARGSNPRLDRCPRPRHAGCLKSRRRSPAALGVPPHAYVSKQTGLALHCQAGWEGSIANWTLRLLLPRTQLVELLVGQYFDLDTHCLKFDAPNLGIDLSRHGVA